MDIVTPIHDPISQEERRQRQYNARLVRRVQEGLCPDARIIWQESDALPYQPGRTRNRGAGQGIGDFILFWDADIFPNYWAVADAEERLVTGRADMVSMGDMFIYLDVNGAEVTYRQVMEQMYNTTNDLPWSKFAKITHCPGMLAITRTVFETLNGWDPTYVGWGPEDRDIWRRGQILGLTQARLSGPLYHLAHDTSHRDHRYTEPNERRFSYLTGMSAADVLERQEGWTR